MELALALQTHLPVTVRFEQVVDRAQNVADAQKDILIQALRVAFPAVDYFSESSPTTPSRAANDLRVIVKCVACTYVPNAGFQASTLQQNSMGAGLIKLNFNVVRKGEHDGDLRSERWYVDVIEPQMRYVLTAARSLSAGQEVTEDDFRIAKCEATACTSSPSSQFESEEKAKAERAELAGAIAHMTASEGQTIEKNRFTRQALIKPLENVRLLLTTASGLQIRTRARALSSGFRGGRVRVEVSDANAPLGTNKTKIIEATVIGANEVKYEF